MTHRNDPCPCGSGQKYKKCCEGKHGIGRFTNRHSAPLIVGIGLLVAAGVLALTLNRADTPPAAASASADPIAAPGAEQPLPAAGASQAAVPAPPPADIAVPGRVWSPEHGHWHNVTQNSNPIVVETTRASSAKVVSVPRPETATVQYHPQPDGPVPPGKVWSPLHGHWHEAAADGAASEPTGPAVMDVPQPDGPVPPGKVWSREHGHWHDAPQQ
jgi:hypothetical protein